MNESVKILFVLPNNCENDLETSNEMQQAYEACKQNNINVNWCSERDCRNLELKKTDFLVFQSFEGEAFEDVKNQNCVRIVGPWCLLTCLTLGQKVPNFPWPIYSVAMIDCKITASSLSKHVKKDLQTKIEYMGGFFSQSLMENCTHLITDSVKSEKYIKAAEANVKIMLSSWVDDVWQNSLKRNVHCNDEEFEKHRCPIFHKLVICCTGFNAIQRMEVQTLINENGGVYKQQLHVNSTDFLICESNEASAKYKAAVKHKIKCVTVSWIRDSIKNGFAVSDQEYVVTAKSTSTPTKEGENVPPNFSIISNIGNNSMATFSAEHMNTIDMTSTQAIAGLTPVEGGPNLKRKYPSNEHDELVEGIDLKRVKMAGSFLDGCGVYVVGFGAEQREKLCRILNFSGATRYDDISERVTHVVVGNTKCHEFKVIINKISLNNCSLVNVNWLLDSLDKKQPLDEFPYIVNAVTSPIEPSSPLSKKGLHLLRTPGNTPKIVPRNLEAAVEYEPEVDLVQQYLPSQTSQEDTLANLLKNADNFDSRQEASKPCEKAKPEHKFDYQNNSKSGTNLPNGSLSSAVDDSSGSQSMQTLCSGLKFMIIGFAEEPHNQVALAIENMAGKIVSKLYKGIPDYAVLPTFCSELKQTAQEIVNDLWITECYHENELRPVEYYHKPMSVKEGVTPLENCVVSLSTYANYERTFLKYLIMKLGGICQEQFSRKNHGVIVASTHLVSYEATGKKYEAAIKWGLPVVNKDWLLECARCSTLVDETPYLLGDAKCVARDKQETELVARTSVNSVNNSTPHGRTKSTNSSAESVGSPLSVNKNISVSTKTVTDEDTSATPPDRIPNNAANSFHTPVNKILKNFKNVSSVCSQITPVQKIIAEARKKNLLGTPEQANPRPLPWDHVDTPETPLGAFIRPNPSPRLRKEMVRFLNTLPERKSRRESTPLSELKRQLWDKICPPGSIAKPSQPNFEDEEDDTTDDRETSHVEEVRTPTPAANNVISHLQHLQEMLATTSANRSDSTNARRSIIPVASNEIKESQPNTVGWEDFIDTEIDQNKSKDPVRVFMFSGIEKELRQSLTSELESLGAVVSNLNNFDLSLTHLVCSKLSRNEKTLSSMASGKWILHQSYVDECVKEGRFIDEEAYEYGNPKSLDSIYIQGDKENVERLNTNYYWRKEIERRGYGAFHDMRVIVLSEKKENITKVLEAGGGVIVEASIPFTQPIHATHCLINFKTVKSASDFIPLAKQGILCVNTIYVNDFLQRKPNPIKEYIYPPLLEHYDFNE